MIIFPEGSLLTVLSDFLTKKQNSIEALISRFAEYQNDVSIVNSEKCG